MKHFDWMSDEEKKAKLSASSSLVLDAINKLWPTNPLEVAEYLNDRGKGKSLSAKYIYHFKKLHKIGLIKIKKIGNTYIAWPREIEKLRVIKEMVGEI